MTVINTTITNYNIPAIYKRANCGDPLPEYKVVAMRRKTDQEYATEHRTKPTSLIDAMTYRAKVFNDDARPMVYSNRYGASSCYIHQFSYEYQWPQNQGWALEPIVNWQTDLLGEIKSRQVNLGASVFEFRETASMFQSAARGVVRAWKAYKGQRRFLARKLRMEDVAAAELTFSFGINPLLSVLHDSLEALQDRLVLPIWLRYKLRRSSTENSYYSPSVVGGYPMKGHRRVDWKKTKSIIAYVQVEPEDPDFTMGNPLEVAWELVPFSWLVDGLISIGDYLSALDALKGVNALRCSCTTREYMFLLNTLKPSYLYDWHPGTAKYRSYERHIYDENSVSPELPMWQPSRSWHKIMHATSILVGIRGSRVRNTNRPFL